MVALALLGAAPAGAAPRCPAVPGAASVPSPAEALGRASGAAPVAPAEAEAYLRRLDAATDRVRVETLGASGGGRPVLAALAGDPRELAASRLTGTDRAAAAVRLARGTPAQARRTARERPAFAWITGAIHGNEPSGAEAALDVLHDLATGTDCATRRRLDGLVTVVLPVQNPDGLAVGGRVDGLGFDLNRDNLARSRPETLARRRGMLRHPPLAVLDLHEQGGSTVFVPPYGDPVLREIPAGARRLTDRVLSPPISRAVRGLGRDVEHGGAYDLLFPGFGDSSAALLFGAAGMTIEVGSRLPLPDRVAAHHAAAWAALGALEGDRATAVRRLAADARAAVRDGRAGSLGPDEDGGPDRDVAGRRVDAHVLRTDRHPGDAAALADRLRADGVRVRRLTRTTTLRGYDPWGPARVRTARLPAGTLVVPAAQPLRAWAQALLAERPEGSGAGGSDDVVAWSQGLMQGLDGGVLRRPVPASRLGALRPPSPGPAAGTAALDGDDAAGLRIALRAAARGRAVRRAGRALVVDVDATLRTEARRAGVPLRGVVGVGADGPAVTAPRVAVLTDPAPRLDASPASLSRGEVPAGWTGLALARAGLATTSLDAGAVAAGGVPPGTTHVVVPDLPELDDADGDAVAARLRAFAEAGGTVVAVGEGGLDATGSLGGVRSAGDAPERGTIAATTVRGGALGLPDGRGWGLPGDMGGLLLPAGATAVVRASSGRAASTPGSGAAARLAGRALVGVQRVGAGRLVAFAGDPAFRADHDGGERLLLAALATR